VRGKVVAIQAFSFSCRSAVSRQLPPSWLKVASPSIPSSRSHLQNPADSVIFFADL
jgi:hypothetical protein